jgi:hypothetical protein
MNELRQAELDSHLMAVQSNPRSAGVRNVEFFAEFDAEYVMSGLLVRRGRIAATVEAGHYVRVKKTSVTL